MSRLPYLLLAACALAACDSDDPNDRPSLIADPAGDFLAGFAGTRGADLDVRSAEVSYDGTTFTFGSTSAGAIGTTAGGIFVWGVNRGAGTAGFPTLAPGVRFDAVVIVRPGGTSSVRDLISGTGSDLAAGSVTVSGTTLTARVPATLLPTQGAQPEAYTVNLWPRTGTGNDNQISDFAPDNSNVPVRDVQ